MNIVPGQVSTFWFTPKKPGRYEAMCAQLCGVGHPNMRGTVIVEDEPRFRAWLASQPTFAATRAPPPPDASMASAGPLAVQGKSLAQSKGCVACHSVAGANAPPGLIGPNLTHFASRTTFAGSTLDNTPAQVAQWLHDPPALKPGSDMPNLGLTRDQIDALVAYLEGLK